MRSQFIALSILGMTASDLISHQDDKKRVIHERRFHSSSSDLISTPVSVEPSSSTPAKVSEAKPSLGGLSATVDGGDASGFRTPTSHKIPEIQPCPPAPRKQTATNRFKRKISPHAARIPILLDLSKEVESMFPPNLRADLSRKIKKARIDPVI